MINRKQGENLDNVAIGVFRCLVEDFRAFHGHGFARSAESALNAGIPTFRDYEWPTLGLVDANRFKAWRQLEFLFKRHTFAEDKYTSDERASLTLKKFFDFQVERSVYRPITFRTSMVIREARRLARDILRTPFSWDEAMPFCKIGTRATLGGPLEEAYLDIKVGKPRCLTCPPLLRDWFFKNLETDTLLKSEVKKVYKSKWKNDFDGPQLDVDLQNLVFVPKSWKVDRSISPSSLIGLYASYGIGKLVELRLSDRKLNIKRLQEKHRRMVRGFSRTRTHVTADLSSASDSLTSDLLNRVLPRSWYVALKTTFCRNLRYKNRRYHTMSVLPMGNAATFPVETLVFYCLIKAIGNLLNVKGEYSVYGDDLIYPSRIHSIVVDVFTTLGLKINKDKTFVSSYFRESCGSDFYRGFDVRPALLPDNTSEDVEEMSYIQYLYKVLNSLLFRWSEHEIPHTCAYLKHKIYSISHEILQVPDFFPPTSGLQVEIPSVDHVWNNQMPRRYFANGEDWVQFTALLNHESSRRQVRSEAIYYWDSLRKMSALEMLGTRIGKFGFLVSPCTPVSSKYAVLDRKGRWRKAASVPLRSKGHVKTMSCVINGAQGAFTAR